MTETAAPGTGAADAGTGTAEGRAGATGAAGAIGGVGSSQPILTTKQIEGLLPHRWPFLLVDRIVEYEPERKRIVGLKSVTATEWFFQGHFPGQPIMPGVLQVEALAQTMGLYVAQQPGFGDRLGLFASIEECRFKRIVVPGDQLRLEVTMERLGSKFGRGHGIATVEGDVACDAKIAFIIAPESALR